MDRLNFLIVTVFAKLPPNAKLQIVSKPPNPTNSLFPPTIIEATGPGSGVGNPSIAKTTLVSHVRLCKSVKGPVKSICETVGNTVGVPMPAYNWPLFTISAETTLFCSVKLVISLRAGDTGDANNMRNEAPTIIGQRLRSVFFNNQEALQGTPDRSECRVAANIWYVRVSC